MSESGDGTQDSVAPTWFHLEIENGLEHLVRLRLAGRPQTEADTRDTAEGWVLQLWPGYFWDVHRDTPTLRTAFRDLGNVSRYWPTPADLLNAMTGNVRTLPTVDQVQLTLPSPSGDMDFGEVGGAIRLALRVLPSEQHRFKFIETIGVVMQRYIPYHTLESRRQEILEACDQVMQKYSAAEGT